MSQCLRFQVFRFLSVSVVGYMVQFRFQTYSFQVLGLGFRLFGFRFVDFWFQFSKLQTRRLCDSRFQAFRSILVALGHFRSPDCRTTRFRLTRLQKHALWTKKTLKSSSLHSHKHLKRRGNPVPAPGILEGCAPKPLKTSRQFHRMRENVEAVLGIY